MVHSDKGSKAKTLATASTLQKVVCPAPERDPQEILSNGWRKVGEQKRVTNRIANGQDAVYIVSSRDGSFSDSSNQASRPNGRQVLDKMFGHLRPHHNIMPTTVLKLEDQELENGLGTQAARLAYFRPPIGPVLNALPADAPIVESSVAAAGIGTGVPFSHPRFHEEHGNSAGRLLGGGYTNGPEVGELEAVGVDDTLDGERPSPSWAPGGTSPRSSPRAPRYRLSAAVVTAGGLTPAPPPPRDDSLTRKGSGGGGGGGGGGGSGCSNSSSSGGGLRGRRAALPSVVRHHPSDNNGLAPGLPFTEAPRLPAAAGATAAGAFAAAHPNRRRASISGDMALPYIAGAESGGGAAAAVGPAAGGTKGPAGRARRMSLSTGGDGGGGGGGGGGGHAGTYYGAAGVFLPASTTGSGGGSGPRPSGVGSSGGAMPQIMHKTGLGAAAAAAAAAGGSPYSTNGEATGARWSPRAHAGAGGSIGGGHTALENASPKGNGARMGTCWNPAAVATITTSNGSGGCGSPVHRISNLSVAGGGSGGGGLDPLAATHIGILAQLGGLHHGPGAAAASPAAIVVNPAVPLSGLDNLATTGLGDAISQLRIIRMGVGTNPGGNSSSGQVKEVKERKQEPGLAGVVSLQLLPVQLPPVDSWQMSGKKEPELDPCKGIRLVDTANYVLPRPTAEVCLQAKMAQHQAAIRELVKAEGAPMSESEMEAVKLLGRLERSGARHRNFDDMDGSEAPPEDVELP